MSGLKFRVIDGCAVEASIDVERAAEAVRRYRLGKPGIKSRCIWQTDVQGVRVFVVPALIVPERQRV